MNSLKRFLNTRLGFRLDGNEGYHRYLSAWVTRNCLGKRNLLVGPRWDSMGIPELVESGWISIDPMRVNSQYSTADRHYVANLTYSKFHLYDHKVFNNIVITRDIFKEPYLHYQTDYTRLIDNLLPMLTEDGVIILASDNRYPIDHPSLRIIGSREVSKITFVQLKRKC